MSEEREIDLIDLLAEVLRHWRGALISLLVGALCLGAYSFLRTDRGLTPEEEKNLSVEDRNAIDAALLYDELYVFSKEYEDSSVFMKFDPENVPSVKLTFAVEAGEDSAYEIAQAYQASFSRQALAEKILRDTDIEDDLSELIIFSIPGAYSEKGTRYFSVECAYPEAEKCEEIGGVIRSYFLEKSSAMRSSLGEHTVKAVSTDIACSQDWSYQTKQQQIMEKALAQKNAVVNAVSKLTEDQKAYFVENSLSDLWQEEAEAASADNTAAGADAASDNTSAGQLPAKKGVSLKLTVIGAIAFCFLYFLFWGIRYILDGHIKTSDDLLLLVGAPHSGSICTAAEPAFAIDRAVYRLKHHGKRIFPPEKSIELIASNLSVNAGKKNVDSVTVIGCDLEKKAKEHCEKLARILKDVYHIEANVLNDIVYDQKAVEALADSRSVVFVETAGITLYSDLEKEAQLISQLAIPVLGGVIAE